jgi:hypothetical protein
MSKVSTDDCWLYARYKDVRGYGRYNKGFLVHRLMYESFIGDIPEDLEIDHLCEVTSCINPEHLEAVTHRENTIRGGVGNWQRATTECPKGHAYDNINTYFHPKDGRRFCRECAKLRMRIHYAKA